MAHLITDEHMLTSYLELCVSLLEVYLWTELRVSSQQVVFGDQMGHPLEVPDVRQSMRICHVRCSLIIILVVDFPVTQSVL